MNYSLLTRLIFANLDTDLTACYDIILCFILSLTGTSRKYVVNKQNIFVHVEKIQEAIYKVKLSTKVSETGYNHCTVFPIYDTVQGLTISPMMWFFISCMLFDCPESEVHLMKIYTPSVDIKVTLNLIGFMDDTTFTAGAERTYTIQDVLAKMQDDNDTQLWQDLLWFSNSN